MRKCLSVASKVSRAVAMLVGVMITAGTLSSGIAWAQFKLGSQPQQLLSVEIKANQFDRMRHFYIDVIGLKELPGSMPMAKPKQSTSLSFSGTYADNFLSITHTDADGQTQPPALAPQHLTFKVTDAKSIVERARAAGAVIVRSPVSAHGMANLIVALLRDPDGDLVELVQPPA